MPIIGGPQPLPLLPPFTAPFGKITAPGVTVSVRVAVPPSTGGFWTSAAFDTVDPTKATLMGSGARAAIMALGYPDPNNI
jgi:hypothetical protein